MKEKVTAVLAVGILVALWELMAGEWLRDHPIIEPGRFGRPSGVVKNLFSLFSEREAWIHIRATVLEEALTGLAIGSICGVVVAWYCVRDPRMGGSLLPIVNGINAVPRLALAPLLIAWFGIGLGSKVVLVMAMTFFPVFYVVYQGGRTIDVDLLRAAKVIGARERTLLRRIVLPSLEPWFWSGVRTASGLSVIGAVLGEYLGSTRGLGYLLMQQQGLLNVEGSLAVIVILAVTGMLLNGAIRVIERLRLRWQETQGEQLWARRLGKGPLKIGAEAHT